MGRDLLCVFERAAVLQVSSDPGRPKSMTAGGVGQAGGFGPPLDHVKHVAARHRISGQFVSFFKAPK